MDEIRLIRSRIERAMRSRWWRARAPRLMGHALSSTSVSGPAGVEGLRRFIEQYVQIVPDILEKAEGAAEADGSIQEIKPLFELAAGYWEWEEDLIPDRFGLFGLIDDAYLTLRLLERFDAERGERTGRSLWQGHLPPLNRRMAALLGDELSARLEREVEAALERSRLQAAMVALQDLRDQIQARELEEPVRALEEELPDEPVVGQVVQEEKNRFDLRETIRGNVSILALALGVGVFTGWQIYFRYPADASVNLLGWDGLQLAWLDRLRTFILGSLGVSALFAEGNLKSLIGHIFWPFQHIKAPELKRFLAAPGTAVLSLLAAALFCWVSFSHVSVRLVPEPEGSDYMELVVDLFRPGGAFLFTQEEEEDGAVGRRRARVETGGTPIRLALPGLEAGAVLVLRDKYSLITVDAFSVERTPLGVRVEPLDLETPPPAALDEVERQEYVAPESLPRSVSLGRGRRWAVTLTGVRWNRGIYNRVKDSSGEWWGIREVDKRLSVKPADGRRCPAPSDLAAIRDFWTEMCDGRSSVAEWTELSNLVRPNLLSVFHSLPSYGLEIHYADGLLTSPGGVFRPLKTREAFRLVALRRGSQPSIPEQPDGPPGQSS